MDNPGRHHLHVRKRVYKNLEPFPHQKTFVHVLDRAMPILALFGPIALIPQVLQVLVLQDASDLSPFTWILWELLSVVWLIYGIVHKELPIIIGNGAYLVLHAILIGAILVY